MSGVWEGGALKRARLILLRVLLFGMLGAVMTCAVAYPIALLPVLVDDYLRWRWRHGVSWIRHNENWSVEGISYFGYFQLAGYSPGLAVSRETRPQRLPELPMWSIFHGEGPPKYMSNGVPVVTPFEQAAGWPFKALHASQLSGFSMESKSIVREQYSGLHFRSPLTPDHTLPIPLSPWWPGFAANTAIYGLAWFGLAFGVGRLKHRRRRRRGLCAFCKYDLSGVDSDTCPECGKVAR